MDTLYSLSLLVSLLSGMLAIVCSAALRLPKLQHLPFANRRGRAYLRRGALTCASVAFAALVCSISIHLAWGHRPGSAEALRFIEFFRIHPSFLAAAALPVIAVLLVGRNSRS